MPRETKDRMGGVLRTRRELIEMLIECRGRAMQKEIAAGRRKAAKRIAADLDDLRERLANEP